MSGSDRRQNDISARRIAQADQAGKRKGGPKTDTFGAGDSLTHLPSYPSRTAEQKAAADRMDALDALRASRGVARVTMYRAHGCTGFSCRHPAHGKHRADRDEFLQALGLRPYAPAGNPPCQYGRPAADGIQPGGTQ